MKELILFFQILFGSFITFENGYASIAEETYDNKSAIVCTTTEEDENYQKCQNIFDKKDYVWIDKTEGKLLILYFENDDVVKVEKLY